jgi:hypothetical protein
MSKLKIVILLVIAVCPALLIPTSIAQITVYNNFGPGNGGWDYNYGMGWTVAGINVPAQYGCEQAMGFQSTASGAVSDVWVAFFYCPLDTLTDIVTVKLAENPNGLPPTPENVMEEWTITEFQSWSQWSPPHHLEGSGASNLQESSSYWLWASGGITTWCGWCLNINPALTCPHTLRREGENWLPISLETASAFRVDVGTPWELQINITNGSDSLNLSWNAYPGARYYHIYASSNPYSDFELITNCLDTTWTTELPNEHGFYKVTAEN